VVCGLLLVIATLVPTRAFISVDLPTFGRPTKHAKPDLNPGWSGGAATVRSATGWAGPGGDDGVCGDSTP